MSSYKILNAQKLNSKKLGVVIKPSKNASKGREFAVKRKTAYKARHSKTMGKVGSASYYANKIIWS